MRIFTTGVAALALAATGALAQGNGNGNGKGPGAKERGGPQAQLARGAGKPGKARADRSGPPAVQTAERRDDQGKRRDDRRDVRIRYDTDGDRPTFFRREPLRSSIDGCPPGLARKDNGCLPPGQAKKRTSWGSAYQPSLFGLRSYDRGNYSYSDGYLLRLGDGGRISGYIPLLGGALAIGNPWPAQYQSYSVPDYYVDYYSLNGPDSYRYADNVIYRVDPDTAAIQSVAALLTGNDIVVGQPMPRGYDIYNVPYAYRDRYYDTPDAYYRYSDGYVYRIDPETQLVAAAIDLLI